MFCLEVHRCLWILMYLDCRWYHCLFNFCLVQNISSVSDFLIPSSYSFRLLKPAGGWFSANLSCSGCWVMGMIMAMINIWDRGLSYWKPFMQPLIVWFLKQQIMYMIITILNQKSFYILHFRLTYKGFGYFDRENCIFFCKSFIIYKF